MSGKVPTTLIGALHTAAISHPSKHKDLLAAAHMANEANATPLTQRHWFTRAGCGWWEISSSTIEGRHFFAAAVRGHAAGAGTTSTHLPARLSLEP